MRLHQTYKDSSALYMITELIKGQELYDHILQDGDSIGNTDHMFYAANVVLMFETLHRQDIVYRDLKPENVIVGEDGYLKLIDFGFARKIKDRTWTFCGSPDYLAPEVMKTTEAPS